MKGTQKQVIESYQRVQVFLTGNPLPPPASYGAAKERLDEVVARLTTHSGDQATTIRLAWRTPGGSWHRSPRRRPPKRSPLSTRAGLT